VGAHIPNLQPPFAEKSRLVLVMIFCRFRNGHHGTFGVDMFGLGNVVFSQPLKASSFDGEDFLSGCRMDHSRATLLAVITIQSMTRRQGALIAREGSPFREVKAWEDCRCGATSARSMLAALTVADVEGKGSSGWRGEGYRLALASDIHLDGFV
jgi:hypothetical protein